jgi:hypothetical protein
VREIDIGCSARRAALACVVLAGALAVIGCSPSSRCPPGAFCCPPGAFCPAPQPPRLAYVLTINGQSAAFAENSPLVSYPVRPGEQLLITVAVSVPRHLSLRALWLGISTGTWGNGPGGRPTGMKPILAHSRRPLAPGVHTFALRWRIPQGQSADRLYLVSAWTSHRPPVSVAGAIAVLAVQ